jgi:S1-C subfamily serine protease
LLFAFNNEGGIMDSFLTNAHVIENAGRLDVTLLDGNRYFSV